MNVYPFLTGLKPRKLILHFDINQTITAQDPAGRMSFAEGLNKSLAHAAALLPLPDGSFCWHDRTPLQPQDPREPPPLLTGHLPPGLLRFDDVHRDLAKSFARSPSSPGVIYRPLLDWLLAESAWAFHPPHEALARRPCAGDVDGGPDREAGDDNEWEEGDVAWRHFLVPAFFRTLVALRESQVEFLVCLRTMGTDLPAVAEALDAFSRGEHPMFPCVGSAESPADWARMSHRNALFSRGGDMGGCYYSMPRQGLAEGWMRHPLSGEPVSDAEAVRFFEDMQHASNVVGLRDDYQLWRSAGYAPTCGKPVWYTRETAEEVFHIFFDDNIHNKADDSIVSVRARVGADEPFRVLSGEEVQEYLDITLVKVNIIDAILDEYYFLKLIHQCLNRHDLLTRHLPV